MGYTTIFPNGFTLMLEWPEVNACSQQGDRWDAVNDALTMDYVRKQLDNIEDGTLKAALMEEGAWTGEELLFRADNERRIVWIAACQILEDEEKYHTADPMDNGEHPNGDECYFCTFQRVAAVAADYYWECRCQNSRIGNFYIHDDEFQTLDGWVQTFASGYVSYDTLMELKTPKAETPKAEMGFEARFLQIMPPPIDGVWHESTVISAIRQLNR